MAAGEVFTAAGGAPWETVGEGVRRQMLSWDKDMMMVRVDFAKGAVGAPHSHPHRQCSVVEAGAFDVTISGETRRLVAGDTFIVPADAVHGVVAIEQGRLLDVFTPMREDFVG